MKKILFFASDYKIGLSSLLTDQLIALHKSNINVIGIAGDNSQEEGLEQRLNCENVRFMRINGLDNHSDYLRLVTTIKHIIISEQIDIVHVQNNWQLALLAMVRLKLLFVKKIQIVYTLHGFRNNNPIKSRIAQIVIGLALFLFADKIICMTDYLRKKFCVLSYKIEMLPLGVNDSYFDDPFIEPDTSSLVMIFPAQFRYGKSQDMIIRAFAKHVKKIGDGTSILILPGQGDLKDEMIRLAEQCGLSSQVKFPGLLSKSEIKKAYLNSNVAIISSNSETFGQSIVEPYVLGRCVLSRPVGIAPEIIQNHYNGYIFNNEDDLSELITYLYNNSVKIKEIGENNFNKRDTFRWSVICEEYKKRIIF